VAQLLKLRQISSGSTSRLTFSLGIFHLGLVFLGCKSLLGLSGLLLELDDLVLLLDNGTI
jgi:hypothetical protein